MGAAGRDFHTFNTCFRDNPEYEVVAFTAAQIPGIENRRYPPSLSGLLYPDGIPIYPEERLEALILEEKIQQVIFAYSDISHITLMHFASRVVSRGADFRLIGPEHSNFRI
jgi:predicted GTPase